MATRRCCGLHFEVASVLHLTTIFQQRWGRHSSHQNMQSNVPYAGFWNLYHTYLWNWSSRSTVRANILKLNMVFQFRARCTEARAVRGTSSAHLPREGRWVRYAAPSSDVHPISSDSVARYTLYAWHAACKESVLFHGFSEHTHQQASTATWHFAAPTAWCAYSEPSIRNLYWATQWTIPVKI